MNSPFKFPRRVRIHGGGCGAVARALHHKAETISLPAVDENVSSTTNERKSMSTKTTLKRIALAAVAALGIGVLTAVAPASATNVYSSSSASATLGTTLNHTVSTVVTTSGTTTTGTLYWLKTVGDSTSADSALSGYELDDSFSAVTVSAQAASGVDTGSITWTRASGSNQIRLDYKKTSATPGVFTLCTNDTADGVCETGNALWTVTYSSAATTVLGGTSQLFAALSTTTASSSYASPSSATLSQIASNASYIEFESQYEDIALTAPDKYFVTVTDSTFTSVETANTWSCNGTTVDASTECDIVASTVMLDQNFRVDVPATGTATVKLMKRTFSGGVATDSTLQTYTISGTAATTTYSYATVTTVSQNNGYVVDSNVYAPSAASSLAYAKVSTAQFSTANAALADASAKAVVLTITGRGSLASAAGGAVTAVVADSLDAADDYYIYGDGTAGTGSLAVSVNGVVVKTIALTFYGAPASIVVTPVYSIGRSGGYAQGVQDTDANGADVSAGPIFSTTVATAGVDNDPSIVVEVKDANGNLTPATISVSSSNPSVVVPLTSADSFVDSGDGIYSGGTFARHFIYTTGSGSVSGQSSTLTFTHTLSSGVAVSASTVITVGGVPYTEKLSFDKATYAPGEAMIITRTAVDSAGNPVADNLTANAVSFNKAIGGSGVAASWYEAGKAYSTQATRPTAFAPATSGAFEARMTGKVNGATAAIVATATVSDTATDAAVNAAADAAAEAIDAANAATDAANLAAEAADAATVAAEEARDAADAATAAVEALATEVATLMAALKAQITTLANTVAKIAKKVKA